MRRSRMPNPSLRAVGVVAMLALAVLLAGCEQKSPEEQIAEIRALYTAEVNQGGFYVKEEPVEETMAEGEEGEVMEGEEEAAAEEPEAPMEEGEAPAEGEEMEAAPAEPETSDVVLDILVRHDSNRWLPGVTVDVVMESPEGEEKNRWKLWVDTSELPKGTIEQITHELTDIAYEEGDRFRVEVRHPVPAAERGEYREFSMEPL